MIPPTSTAPARTFYRRPLLDRLTGHYTVEWDTENGVERIQQHLRFRDFEGRRPSAYSLRRLPTTFRTWLTVTRGRELAHPLPLLVFDAIRELEKVIGPGTRVLEIGGGNSTLWFLGRGASVTTVETSPEWGEQIKRRAGADGERLTLLLLGGEAAREAVRAMPDGSFDALLVDSESAANWRADFIADGRSKVRPGGIVVLDNSDHPNQWSARAAMGSPAEVHTGFAPMAAVVTQTSIWRV